MSGLNEQQYEAVHYRGKSMLVLAGAGSGKTRVITERIAALVEREVPLDAITAVTFTNKAAKEMRQRLKKRLGKKEKKLRICTFHALGLEMIREHAALVGRSSKLAVFAESEQRAALRSVLQDLRLPSDKERIDILKKQLTAIKSGQQQDVDPRAQRICDEYDTFMQRMNAVDFDDLIVLPAKILAEHEDVRWLWRARCRHFLVDEYQDSSRTQYDLVKCLVTTEQNLTVVGDDDQAIYGWRGADAGNLFQLEKDYPALHVIRLEQNYRSTGAILSTANTLIANNSQRIGKELRSNMGMGKAVRVWQVKESDDEAERVAADLRAQYAKEDAKWQNMAVLYRAGYQARVLEIALREANVPYHVSGGLSFFERSEIKDVLAYLKLTVNMTDDLSFIRAISKPRRGVGAKTLAALSDFAATRSFSLLEACLEAPTEIRKADAMASFGRSIVDMEHGFLHLEPDTAFDQMLEASRLIGMIESEAKDEKETTRKTSNIESLRAYWLRYSEAGGQLDGFLQQIFLQSNKDEEADESSVRLMTVHAAKGLEFDHVYVVGMEDGTFPHKNALDEGRIEEERRLLYVAITRARYRLTLSMARRRKRYGQTETLDASRFLAELENKHVDWVDRDPESAGAKEEVEDSMARIREMLGL
ncbi:MAG: 3'-5' exonuclease [Mariprofundaceae bacterium]|nr:3'-5' exonuclease [Mariprofundaceae bacterium]